MGAGRLVLVSSGRAEDSPGGLSGEISEGKALFDK